MACLGGTWEDPRPWVRFSGGAPVNGETIMGRICDKTRMPWASTRRRFCHGCPAYRGKDWDGNMQGALAADGETVQSLRLSEYVEYARWVEEEFEPERFYLWLEEGNRGISEEAQAEYMRKWRAEHPGYDRRKRDRAAYMREYRRRRSVTRNRPARAGAEPVKVKGS